VLANVTNDFLNAWVGMSVSDRGILVYTEERRDNRLVWVGRNGEERLASAERGSFETPRVSPDGTRFVVAVREGMKRNLRLFDVSRGLATRLTFGDNDSYPAWSADGDWIYFSTVPKGALDIYRVPSDGSKEPQLVVEGPTDKHVSSLSVDGRWLAFVDVTTQSLDVGLLSLQSGEGRPFVGSQFMEAAPAISPDGQWVAYESNESGRFEVYLRRSDGKGAKILVSDQGGELPVWSRTQNEIYFWSRNRFLRVTVPADSSSGLSRPVELFKYDGYRVTSSVADFDVAPRGEFLMVRSSSQGTELKFVLNWFEELKRLVPTEN
jgi:serine/threonine-protein kinase